MREAHDQTENGFHPVHDASCILCTMPSALGLGPLHSPSQKDRDPHSHFMDKESKARRAEEKLAQGHPTGQKVTQVLNPGEV